MRRRNAGRPGRKKHLTECASCKRKHAGGCKPQVGTRERKSAKRFAK